MFLVAITGSLFQGEFPKNLREKKYKNTMRNPKGNGKWKRRAFCHDWKGGDFDLRQKTTSEDENSGKGTPVGVCAYSYQCLVIRALV